MQMHPLQAPDPADAKVKVKAGAGAEYQPKLGCALLKVFGPTFLVGSGFKLLHDILLFVSPLLLK